MPRKSATSQKHLFEFPFKRATETRPPAGTLVVQISFPSKKHLLIADQAEICSVFFRIFMEAGARLLPTALSLPTTSPLLNHGMTWPTLKSGVLPYIVYNNVRHAVAMGGNSQFTLMDADRRLSHGYSPRSLVKFGSSP